MSLADDLTAEVVKIFKEQWTSRDGRQVPDTPDLKLANDAVKINATVLYADLADSSGLVANFKPEFAAEVYKTYLICACRIIRARGGEITSFDGDRVMAVFIGDSKNTNAMKTALQINYAVVKIINPKLKAQYPTTTFEVKQAVGIDTSDLFVARTGIRGSNDLVWVGNAANRAAKLCALREGSFASWATAAVYNAADAAAKFKGTTPMWEQRSWTSQGGATVYGSNWNWEP